jgi:hypothetical protein
MVWSRRYEAGFARAGQSCPEPTGSCSQLALEAHSEFSLDPFRHAPSGRDGRLRLGRIFGPNIAALATGRQVIGVDLQSHVLIALEKVIDSASAIPAAASRSRAWSSSSRISPVPSPDPSCGRRDHPPIPSVVGRNDAHVAADRSSDDLLGESERTSSLGCQAR